MQVSLFYLPSLGPRREIEKGLAGLREDLYQQMLSDLKDQAQAADALGYDSISFTEHHFHIEGFEISNNPVLLDLYVAAHTERIRVGQLGIVLPAHSPLRVAEDIAMLDHMSGGRANAGFARGYQRRWVDVLAQHLHGIHGAAPGQHDAIDQANREAFEEHYRIIKRAWSESLISDAGPFWQIPPPETPWDLDATRQWGSGIEEGKVTAIGVVPKPLQKPHPPIFQPFASSERTIRWCAREGVTAILPPMNTTLQNQLYAVYAQEAASCGRTLAAGEGLGVLRDVVVADTDQEALRLWRSSGAFVGKAWFTPFHFGDVLAEPGETQLPTPEQMMEQGLLLVGSVGTVIEQLRRLREITPVQWLFAWQYNGLIPNAKLQRSLELFATEVLPAFRD